MTRTTFDRPNGDRIVLDIYAWEKEITSEPRTDEARAWVDAMHEQIVSIVLHPSFQPTEWDERWRTEAIDLAADLGAKWQVLDEPPAAHVIPTEDLTAALPDDTSAGIWRDVIRNGDLAELCAARTEDGMQRAACKTVPGTDVVVSYGVMVDPSHMDEGTYDMRSAEATAYSVHSDGSIVLVRLVTGQTHGVEGADMASVQSWLEEQVPDLARAAGSMS